MNEAFSRGVGTLTWNENVHVIAQIWGLIFHILLQALTWKVSPILQEGGKKKIQGLIHLNKRAVEPATADLRTG